MNQANLFWDKYWARYPGHLFLPAIPDHVLELMVVRVLSHALRFYLLLLFFFLFFFWLAQVSYLNLPIFGPCYTI